MIRKTDVRINDRVYFFDSRDKLCSGVIYGIDDIRYALVHVSEPDNPAFSPNTRVPLERCFHTTQECMADREYRINEYADRLVDTESLVRFLYNKMKYDTDFPDLFPCLAVEKRAKELLGIDLSVKEDELSDHKLSDKEDIKEDIEGER